MEHDSTAIREYCENEYFVSVDGRETAYYHTKNANNDGAVRAEERKSGGKAELKSESENENESEGKGEWLALATADARIKTECVSERPGNSGAEIRRTVLTNTGSGNILVNDLSAVVVAGIGKDGIRPWRRHRFVLHFAHSCWQGEAQWRHVCAEDAGLYRTYNHGSQSTFRLQSKSSWSTCQYEPVLLIEDVETRRTWYVQMRCGHAWSIEAGIRGYRNDTELCIVASDCFEWNNGWRKELKPGESLYTSEAAVGCVDGGFEEAVADLTKASRGSMRSAFPGGVPPLCYNDYMNALWALPDRDKSLRLIDAAAGAGAEYYVIDAGWYRAVNEQGEPAGLGGWEINDALFGDGGLRSVFARIRARGMLPGIWLELESAEAGAPIVKENPGHVLRKLGRPAGGARMLLDFRKKRVRDYLEDVIARLYGAGVRYIKNDYNSNTGPWIDPDGPESLREHSAAFVKFIDAVRVKWPDLVLENCGSGAMRSDLGTLAAFHLQSVSDQEDYFRLPSIVSGSEACYPPERCGIWAYPFPVPIDERETFRPSPEFTARFAGGRLTAYNMVTGLAGLMYLSGRIDCADAANMRLIRDAAVLYKKYRSNISSAVPVYPSGTFDVDSDGVNTFGLLDEAGGLLLLYVWNNSGEAESRFAVDISKYIRCETASVEETYPPLPGYGLSLSVCETGGAGATAATGGPVATAETAATCGTVRTFAVASLPEGQSALFAAIRSPRAVRNL